MKDIMSSGAAKWISFRYPGVNELTTISNPWEKLDLSAQAKPIQTRHGLPLFRKSFTAKVGDSATIDATSLGIFDLYCNGKRVGRIDENGNEVFDELKPGYNEFNKRALYFSYDLSRYLVDGENVILAAVAPGWRNGRIAFGAFKDDEAFIAKVTVNGEAFYTGTDWQATWGGRVRAADIWDGELHNAKYPSYAEMSCAGYDTSDWGTPFTSEHDIEITPFIGPTVMVRPELTRKPLTLTVHEGTIDNGTEHGEINVVYAANNQDSILLKKGQTLTFDLGQNMVGWPTFTAKGAAQTAVQVRASEFLNDSGAEARGNDGPKGSVYTINYRSASAKAYYMLAGTPEGEYYQPTFSFFGFRYIEIVADNDVEILNFTAKVIGSATHETGKMESSNALVNQLISNVIWGQRGNYLYVPTDCPQRDERLGWTGDTQIFCNTAAYNADVRMFFHKWLQDARDSQANWGGYPDVIPAARVVGCGGAAWGDAGIIVPYVMWKMYNDVDLLRDHYDSMKKCMDMFEARDVDKPHKHAAYGDWLAYEPTDHWMVSVAYAAFDARLMITIARVLGKEKDAKHYERVFEMFKAHYNKAYCDENGDLLPQHQTQTAYLMGLKFQLLNEKNRPAAIAALRQKIIDNGHKLSTGFVGTGILAQTLAEIGENDLAYSLLLQRDNPSWLYSVDQGATTIWERWNSYTLATGFGDVGMNSFNHYAYGAIQEWMYRHAAGIEYDPAAPGFERAILQPKPDTRTAEELPEGQENITYLNTSYESYHGTIVSNWSTENGFTYNCEVPVPTRLYLPILTKNDSFTLDGVSHKFSEFHQAPYNDRLNRIVIDLAPGKYEFKM